MHLGDDGFPILRPPLSRRHATMSVPLPDDSWAVDERSLKAFADKLKEPPAERAWYELRREAERIALVPGFDRLITLDANAIRSCPTRSTWPNGCCATWAAAPSSPTRWASARRSRRASFIKN